MTGQTLDDKAEDVSNETQPLGLFYEDTRVAYLREKKDDQAFSGVDISYYRMDIKSPHRASGKKATCSPPNQQCLYLDVGCWTGNGEKSKKNHQKHREFGLVCGSAALLCAYGIAKKEKKDESDKKLKKMLKDSEFNLLYQNKFKPFLDYMSQDPVLGKVTILEAAIVHDHGIIDDQEIDKEILYVFLGDLHLPTVTEELQNEINGACEKQLEPHPKSGMLEERYLAYFDRAGRLVLDKEAMEILTSTSSMIRDAMEQFVNKAKKEIGEVPEHVKTILKEESYLAIRSQVPLIDCFDKKGRTEAIEASRKALEELRDKLSPWSVYDKVEREAISFWHKLEFIGRIFVELQQMDSFASERMNKNEVDKWFEFYNGKGEAKGADIFQDSGKDLLRFLDLMVAYQKENSENKLNFVQLGDCCDFWIGMKCGMKETDCSKPGQPKGVLLSKGGKEFAQYWHEQTKLSEKVGKVLERLEEIAENPPKNMNICLLYGNHDNYMKHIRNREALYLSDSICAEHGHQSDGFNHDENPTQGWLLTQVAFAIPGVRELEDPLSTALALCSGKPPPRLLRIARGADLCIEKKRLIYVMAHTHDPMLRRVTIRPQANPVEKKLWELRHTMENMQFRISKTLWLLDLLLLDEDKKDEKEGNKALASLLVSNVEKTLTQSGTIIDDKAIRQKIYDQYLGGDLKSIAEVIKNFKKVVDYLTRNYKLVNGTINETLQKAIEIEKDLWKFHDGVVGRMEEMKNQLVEPYEDIWDKFWEIDFEKEILRHYLSGY